MLNIIKEYW